MTRLAVLVAPVCVACALLTLPQTLPGQDAQEVERLKRQVEELKKENELLRQEIAALKKGGGQAGEAKKEEARPEELVVDLGHGVKMEFVRIKAGEFLMGSPEADNDADDDEKPQHRVKITKDFYLGKYPVTQEQYTAIMGKNPSVFQPNSNLSNIASELRGVNTARFPVDSVNWDMANEFCALLTERDKQGRKFCLPTEAEWEYACRAGTTRRYVFSDEPGGLSQYAWYPLNAGDPPYRQASGTHPVGTKKPNPWGLYDMQGNVWQWCSDKFTAQRIGDNYYARSPLEDPKGPDRTSDRNTGTERRVLRGNTWGGARGGPQASADSRAAHRLGGAPGQHDDRMGFRVCLRLE